jgi:hypothetical protein
LFSAKTRRLLTQAGQIRLRLSDLGNGRGIVIRIWTRDVGERAVDEPFTFADGI